MGYNEFADFMNGNEDDAESDEKPEKPKKSRYYSKDGSLTKEGKETLREFFSHIIPDADSYLSSEDIENSFDIFDLGQVSDLNKFFHEYYSAYRDYFGKPLEPVLFDGRTIGYHARLVDSLMAMHFYIHRGDDEAVDYLVDGLLPRKGVHMFVGLPESLKSWLAYQIAIDVSQGRPVLDRFPSHQGRAVIADFEVGEDEVRRRLQLLGADQRLFHFSFPPYNLTDRRFWNELQKIQSSLVVVDGLSAGQSGMSEQDTRFAEPLGRAMKFAQQHNITFLFLHHSPKAATLQDVESVFRGTNAIRSKVDSAYYFRRLKDGPSGEVRAEVSPVKTRKGRQPDRFSIQLTDERGVELVERSTDRLPTEEVTNEERVYRLVVSEPGCSTGHIQRELEIRKETLLDLLKGLEQAGRIRVEVGGPGRANAYFPTGPESRPNEPVRTGSERV